MLYRFIEIPWIFKKVAFQVARFFHFYQFKALGICFLFMWTAISFAPCPLKEHHLKQGTDCHHLRSQTQVSCISSPDG